MKTLVFTRKTLLSIAVFFVVLVCLATFTVSANAEESTTTETTIVETGEVDYGEPIETWDISATNGDSVSATLYNDEENSGKYVLSIIGYGWMTDWYDSTYVSWYSYRDKISEVIISDGVANIGDDAFYGCTMLKQVEIPDTISVIGINSFYNCQSLQSMVIPYGVYSIGGGAFIDCTSLTSVKIPDSVTYTGTMVFAGCTNLSEVSIGSGLKTIKNSFFYSCTSLTKIEIPLTVTTIEGGAFQNCTSLTSIKIPQNVNSIGMSAFEGCSSLECVDIPNGITSIPSSAFSDCTSLKSITIPESVTSIGQYAFLNCVALENLYFNATACADLSSDRYTSNGVFGYAGTNCEGVRITVGANVTRIPAYFCMPHADNSSWNAKVSELVFEDESRCVYIGDYAFSGSGYFTRIKIPNGVTSIGSSVFSNCSSLTSIEIPDGVTSIGSNAFYGCNKLNLVIINSSTIASGIISSLSNGYLTNYATTVAIKSDITEVESYVTSNFINVTTLNVSIDDENVTYVVYSKHSHEPDATTWGEPTVDGYVTCTNCGITKEVTPVPIPVQIWDISATTADSVVANLFKHPEAEGYYTLVISGTGNMKNYSSTSMPWYTYREDIIHVTIETGVTSIGNSAFDSCTNLVNVLISDGVIRIGYYAFRNCTSLVSVMIPEGVQNIGTSAFQFCSNLTSIMIPDSVTNITASLFEGCKRLTSIDIPDGVISIGGSAFYNCTNLTSVTFGKNSQLQSIGYRSFRDCTRLTSVTIPGSVQSIGSQAFYSCTSLTSVVFGENSRLQSVGESVFSKCSKLTNISIPESVQNIGSFAFNECSSLTSIEIPANVTSIGQNAFSICKNLSRVNFSENSQLVSIHNYAFDGCHKLTSVTIPAGVTHISHYAFYGCRSLTIVNFSENSQLTRIGDYAFYSCSNLTSITIPAGVTDIGESVFGWCSNLTNIMVDENNIAYKSMDGNLYSRDGKIYLNYAIGKKDTSFIIPEGVTSIGDSAFSGCSSLLSVTIPTSVTNIGISAFSGCSQLKLVTIHSPTVSALVTSYGSGGNLCDYAKTVVILDGIIDVGTYITSTFTNQNELYILFQDGIELPCTVYSKHSHEADATTWSEVDENGIQTCSICGLKKARHVCQWGEWEITAPDFENAGNACRKCILDESHVDNHPIPAINDVDYEYIAPGCETNGSYTYINDLGIDFVYTVDPLGHTYDYVWSVVSDPTVDSVGYLECKCTKDPSHTKTYRLPMLDSIQYEYLAPGCVTSGSYKYTDDEWTVYYELVVEPLGHNWGHWQVEVSPTKTEEGLLKRICLRIDCVDDCEETITLLPLVKENYDEGSRDEDCENIGEYFLKIGDETLRLTTKELGHIYDYENATYSWNDDLTECLATYKCLRDASHTKTERGAIRTTEYVWPECEKDGIAEYEATFSSSELKPQQNSKVLPATGHKYGQWNSEIPETCDSAGVLGHYQCSACKKYFDSNKSEIESIVGNPATGHSYGEWSIVKNPSRSSYGMLRRTCINNERHFETKQLPRFNSNDYEYTVTKPSSCEQGGIAKYTYKIDGQIFEFELWLDPIGHNYGNGEITAKATCATPGTITFICKICGQTNTERMSRTDHDYSVVDNKYICSTCGDSYTINDDGGLVHDDRVINLRGVDASFTFDVIFYGTKDELLERISVIDDFYVDSQYEQDGIVEIIAEGEGNRYTIKPSAGEYLNGHTYVVNLGEGVSFADYSASAMYFTIKTSSTVDIEINDDADVTYVNKSSVLNRTDYDGYTLIELPSISGINIGGFLFLSDASSEKELFGGPNVSLGDILLGNVADIIFNSDRGTYTVKLTSPTQNDLSSIFNRLVVSGESGGIDWSAFSYDEREKISTDLISQFDNYIKGNDELKEFLIAVVSVSYDYGRGKGLSLTEKDEEDPIFNIEVVMDEGDNGEFYVIVCVSFKANYTKDGIEAGYIETQLRFYSDVRAEVRPHVEVNGLRVYFDFEVALIQTTEIDFNVIYNVDPSMLGYETDGEETFKKAIISKVKESAIDGVFDTMHTNSEKAKFLDKLVKKLCGGSKDNPSIPLLSLPVGVPSINGELEISLVFDFNMDAMLELHHKHVDEYVYGARASLRYGIVPYRYNKTVESDLSYDFIGSIHVKTGIGINSTFTFFHFMIVHADTQFGYYADYAGIKVEDGDFKQHDYRLVIGKYNSVEVSATLGLSLPIYKETNNYPIILRGRDKIYYKYDEGETPEIEIVDDNFEFSDLIYLENYYLDVLYYDLNSDSGKIVVENDKLYLKSMATKYSLYIQILEGEEYASITAMSNLSINEDAPKEFYLVVLIKVTDLRASTKYYEDSAYYRLPELVLKIHVVNHDYIETSRTESTCFKHGYIYYECSSHDNCTATQELPLLPHGYTEYLGREKATCDHAERYVYQCSNCKQQVYEYFEGGAEQLQHLYGGWYDVKMPTENITGSKTRACIREGCDHTETVDIPELGYTDGLVYEKCDGGLKVVGYIPEDNMASAEELAALKIPPYYNGLPVVEIEDIGFDYSLASVKVVSIPKTVKEINASGFNGVRFYSPDVKFVLEDNNPYFYTKYGCIINKSDGVLTLGYDGCTIPYDGSVTIIGEYAFYNVTFSNGLLIPFGIVEIREGAFLSSKGIGRLVIPKSVERVFDDAFGNCNDIVAVVKYANTWVEYGIYWCNGFKSCYGIKTVICVDYDGTNEQWIRWLVVDKTCNPELINYAGYCGTIHAGECEGCLSEHHNSGRYTKYFGCYEYQGSRCLHCGESFGFIKTGEVSHDMIFVSGLESTCESNGYTAHCVCRDCGYKEGYEIIESSHDLIYHSAKEPTCIYGWNSYETCSRCDYSTYVEIQPVLDHNCIYHEAKAPTCTEIGWNEYVTCDRDGCDYSTYVELPALGHDDVQHEAKAPTCTEIGWNKYVTCGRDGCDYTTYAELYALGHDDVQHEAKAPTCTEIGWNEYVTCGRDGCDYSTYVELPALGHDEVQHQAKAPTCAEIGWDAYETCQRDGCDYSTYVELPALGHNKEQHSAKAPTCTKHGWNEYVTCDRDGCDYTTYVELPALGHDEVEHEAKAPTCTEIGWNAYVTCERDGCSYTTYVELPALGHDKVHHDAKAPTCTEIGWDAYETCKRDECGYTTYKEIPALGHDEVAHDAKAPTCTEIGWNAYETCKRDGCNYTTYVELPALGHDEISHEAKVPTCTEIGWNEYVTCDRDGCDYATYVELPALGHDEVHHDAKAPTCTEIGWNEYVTCNRNGCDYTSYVELPALGHDEVQHEAKTPTCTEIGWNEYVTCGRDGCDYSTYVKLPALGHDEVTHEAKVPTCTEHGWNAYKTCKRDGCDYTTYEEISVKGHTYGEWTQTVAPGCEAKGEEHRDCVDCDHYETKEISALGHNYGEWMAEVPATCEGEGTLGHYYCVACGKNFDAEKNELATIVIPTLGHTESDWIVDEEGTCTEDGSRHKECTECRKELITETIEKLGHDKVQHEAKAPTCIAIGWNAYETCSRCDYTTYAEIPALGHNKTQHSAQSATCTEIGWNAYETCSRCDYTTYAEISALGHNKTQHSAQSATCTEIGWNAYDTCTRCDYTTYAEIPALGHNKTQHSAQSATCTEIGWNAYETCSRCDYSTYVEIPAVGHNYTSVETVDAMVYTCQTCGHSYSVAIVREPVYLSNTSFVTAWGLDFTTEISTKTGINSGMMFKLEYDLNKVSLKYANVSSGVTVDTSINGVITVKVNRAIEADEKLFDLIFTTYEQLAEGSHKFLSCNGYDEFSELVIYQIGDVNLDGNINSRDVTMIKQYVVKMIELSDAQKIYANAYYDVDANGKALVNSRDAVILQQYVVRMEVELGNRHEVEFVKPATDNSTEGAEESIKYSVVEGEDIIRVPEAQDGYAWSESETAYVAPVYTGISENKKYYLIKSKEN